MDYTLTSWSKQRGTKPVVIERGEGVYIYDADGKKYIDFSSQLIAVNIGHGHPKVTEAVTEQMKEISYVFPGMAKVRGEVERNLQILRRGEAFFASEVPKQLRMQ
jgi:taurine--2-oxoglutarate transaminase